MEIFKESVFLIFQKEIWKISSQLPFMCQNSTTLRKAPDMCVRRIFLKIFSSKTNPRAKFKMTANLKGSTEW